MNLRTGPQSQPPTPFITILSPLEDTNGDTWQETVLRINLGDPGLANPFSVAEFRLLYDGEPTGSVSLNIGDSITNNGGGGDAATQSNDAELNIGRQDADVRDMFIQGNDDSGGLVWRVEDLVRKGIILDLTVADAFLDWDNNSGNQGSINSPFLFALNGQPDSEGAVNYDIFAAFNRVISGPFRHGSGIGAVTVCLRAASDPECLPALAVPEPSTAWLFGLGGIVLTILGGWACRRKLLPA
jgi:hypothetical protein